MATAEKEYIERGALIAEYDRVHVGPPGGARKLMEEAPAADVVDAVEYAILEQEAGKMAAKLQDMEKRDLVEVVRCEKCRHGQRNNIGAGSGSYMCEYDHGKVLRSPLHFCGYGERWEDGDDGTDR